MPISGRLARAFVVLLVPFTLAPTTPGGAETERWRAQAARVSIVRDTWGIAHVRGTTDADAVFGASYAQAEDDFARIEANYLTALGRRAEADGEVAVWTDLRQRLWVDPAQLQAQYRASPAWLRTLMDGWADGLNFYLATHPATKPKVLTRFEPWMALSFTEGSIGGDIERVSVDELKAFYGQPVPPAPPPAGPREPGGSNGIAIASKLTANGRALLLINPHTSFYFRSELQMTSGQGLNAYGAATWGQFFIYQGWNERVGWMHTSSGVDNVDEFAERVARTQGGFTYRYGAVSRPVTAAVVKVRYRRPDGGMGERRFTTYRTHHGPITGQRDGRWIATALMWRPIAALEQSFLRTKTRDLASYLRVASRRANSSNNTLVADADGAVAMLTPQFMPRRNDRFDYRTPVDGADPATDWRGPTPLAGLPTVVNPRGGWAVNTNDWPWEAAGADSPRANGFARYFDTAGPNPRGEHARALLKRADGLTPERLRDIAYDPWMPQFARLVPRLAAAWDRLPAGNRKDSLAEPVALLRGWNARWSAASIATSLGVVWAGQLWTVTPPTDPAAPDEYDTRWARMEQLSDAVMLDAFDKAVARLTIDFGRWRVPWGEINRFQRLDGSIQPRFDDAKPSLPVPFTSALWGSLASFGAKAYPNTKRWYGSSGNSFVAVVEFGPRVRAWAVTAGGASGNPASPHFTDQAGRYATGQLRPVWFYPDDLAGHVERTYRPGD